MTSIANLYFTIRGAPIEIGQIPIITGQLPLIETVSAYLETVIGAIWIVREAFQLAALQALTHDEKSVITAEGTMIVLLASAAKTVRVAVPALMVVLLEVSATFAVVIGTPAQVEGVALLSVTGQTVVVIRASAAQTPSVAFYELSKVYLRTGE